MKNLIIILLILSSCAKSSDESNCNCERNVYKIITTVVFDDNGMPHLQHSYEYQYSEVVVCQDPVSDWQDLGHDQLVYKITCD